MSNRPKSQHERPSGTNMVLEDPHPVNKRKPFRYEPQSVIAARAVMNGESSPPSNLFLPQAVRVLNELCPGDEDFYRGMVRNGVRSTLPFQNCPESIPKKPWLVEDASVRASAIDEALREVFSIYEGLQLGTILTAENGNIFIRFAAALFDEMEALLKEWDELEVRHEVA